MEPLLPQAQSARLMELSCEILKDAGRLGGQVHSPMVFERVTDLVRRMNCYYSNQGDGAISWSMLDQIRFMSGLLGLPELRSRVERYFQFEAIHLTRYREEIMRVVRTLVDEGEVQRSRVQEITGKGATVSVEIIKLGLKEGYFETPSPKGPLRVAFPEKVHDAYFPKLFVDLPLETHPAESEAA